MEKVTLTPLEVAKILGVSRETIYKLVREDKIPHTRVRGSILFHRKTIDAWLQPDSDSTKEGNAEVNTFGKNLKAIRKQKGMTMKEFASYLSCSDAYISQLENGQKVPSLEFSLKLSQRLGVSFLILLEMMGYPVEFTDEYRLLEKENELLKKKLSKIKNILEEDTNE